MAIAIFDVGKTNVKLSLVEAGAIRQTLSAPNRVLPGPPFPHYDEAGIWSRCGASPAWFPHRRAPAS
jgi:hypothetical protein